MSDKTLTFTVEQLADALNNVRCMYDLSPELIAEEVFAALAQQPAPAVPDGWRLVPVEPDERMLAAGRNRHLPQMMSGERLALLYRAMLAAAPAAPADVDDECVHEFVPFQAGCTKCGEPYAAAPAAPVARFLPGLPEQMARDLARFNETCEDGQEYDVPKERMRSMANFGLVRWCGGSRFEITDCGIAALEVMAAPPTAEQPECPECGGNGAGGPHEEDCSLANQPDTVAVPRELLETALNGSAEDSFRSTRELRALLDGGEE